MVRFNANDLGGDSHPEWKGPDKGTHAALALPLIFVGCLLFWTGFLRLVYTTVVG